MGHRRGLSAVVLTTTQAPQPNEKLIVKPLDFSAASY